MEKPSLWCFDISSKQLTVSDVRFEIALNDKIRNIELSLSTAILKCRVVKYL